MISYWVRVWGLLFLSASLWAERKPNIILITLDSARADRMGFLGARSGLTPNLDRFARASLIFEHAYAQAPLTAESTATIFSGTYPQSNHVTEFGGWLPSSISSLPQLLHSAGYRTAALAASPASMKNDSVLGVESLFDVHDSSSSLRGINRLVLEATRWATTGNGTPFFLWVRLSAAAVSGNAAYDASMRIVDVDVGKVLTALRSSQLLGEAVVVITATHGESLGAHGENAHGVFLYDETVRVPLLLKLPHNQMSGERISARSRLIDVAPTIMEVAQAPVLQQMQGQSLLRIVKTGVDEPVYSRSDYPQLAYGWSPLESLRKGKYLYVRAPKPELYDLAADPSNIRNLVQSSKAIADTMAAQLEAFDRRLSDPTDRSGTPQLSANEMQRLASLGYVGLQKTNFATSNATGIDPKDAIATANKVEEALLSLQSGQPESAIAALSPMVQSQPNMYLAQYALGLALVRKRMFAEAVEHFHKAIELQPTSVWAHYEIGASLLKSSDAKTAVIHLEIVVSRLPNLAEAHSLLAQAYDHRGRAEDAHRERDAASKLEPRR